jgi:hypothetical protein
LAIAEDHELIGIFGNAVAPSMHFPQESFAPDQPLHIVNIAAQDATFGGGAGGKQLEDPAIRVQGGWQGHLAPPLQGRVADQV